MTTIEKDGLRLYAANAPFAGKDALKRIGCHWDGDRRQWWIGAKKFDALEGVVATLNGALPAAATAAGSVGLRADAPAFLVADKLREEGRDAEADKVQAAMDEPAPTEDLSACRVYAQVTYKGRRYYVIAETKDRTRCRLTTLDDKPVAFWAAMAECRLIYTYEGREVRNGWRWGGGFRTEYVTVGSLKRFRDQQDRDDGTGRERMCCQECGSWFTAADGCGGCGGC